LHGFGFLARSHRMLSVFRFDKITLHRVYNCRRGLVALIFSQLPGIPKQLKDLVQPSP
jgi:hypothetical protein